MRNNEHTVKKRLIELGAERLADELIENAYYSPAIEEFIDRLTGSEDENIQRYKEKLKGLSDRSFFIEWEDTQDFVQDLCSLLDTLKSASPAPETGLDLIEQFYEADSAIIESCDDSWSVGLIFEEEAGDLFIDYASRCTEKQKVADTIIRLSLQDEYEVRSCLIDSAGELLSAASLRTMIEKLESTYQKSGEGSYRRSHLLSLIQSLAMQLQDIPLYEETARRRDDMGKCSICGSSAVRIHHRYFREDNEGVLCRLLQQDDVRGA